MFRGVRGAPRGGTVPHQDPVEWKQTPGKSAKGGKKESLHGWVFRFWWRDATRPFVVASFLRARRAVRWACVRAAAAGCGRAGGSGRSSWRSLLATTPACARRSDLI